ncbi:hypothetical protein Hypma_016111 [Hypsizygus marmoreus]|uniref:Uncharacterized protein n=1 Tax=Hypsizygus marmoreus TaxID=39966 RepID=A0A369K7A2_HYPMA|nr:hypothetical protein Hypma_016111 [Hypsizygus marmoreus]
MSSLTLYPSSLPLPAPSPVCPSLGDLVSFVIGLSLLILYPPLSPRTPALDVPCVCFPLGDFVISTSTLCLLTLYLLPPSRFHLYLLSPSHFDLSLPLSLLSSCPFSRLSSLSAYSRPLALSICFLKFTRSLSAYSLPLLLALVLFLSLFLCSLFASSRHSGPTMLAYFLPLLLFLLCFLSIRCFLSTRYHSRFHSAFSLPLPSSCFLSIRSFPPHPLSALGPSPPLSPSSLSASSTSSRLYLRILSASSSFASLLPLLALTPRSFSTSSCSRSISIPRPLMFSASSLPLYPLSAYTLPPLRFLLSLSTCALSASSLLSCLYSHSASSTSSSRSLLTLYLFVSLSLCLSLRFPSLCLLSASASPPLLCLFSTSSTLSLHSDSSLFLSSSSLFLSPSSLPPLSLLSLPLSSSLPSPLTPPTSLPPLSHLSPTSLPPLSSSLPPPLTPPTLFPLQ